MKTFNITGTIGGWWGVSAESLRYEFPKDKSEEFKVVLNTNGGDVFEGFAIYQLLAEYENVVVEIGAMVASAGSYAILSASNVLARATSSVMIHKASTIMWGNADELSKEAKLLKDIDNLIASRYAKKTGKTKKSFLQAMKDETWLIGGQSIIDFGLADELIGDEEELSEEAIVNVKQTITASIKNFKNEMTRIKMGENPPKNKNLSNSTQKEEPELKNDKTNQAVNTQPTNDVVPFTQNDIDNAVLAERSRMNQILKVSGLKMNTSVANAINSDQSYSDFCVALAEAPKPVATPEPVQNVTNVAAIGNISAAPEARDTVPTATIDPIKAELDAMVAAEKAGYDD